MKFTQDYVKRMIREETKKLLKEDTASDLEAQAAATGAGKNQPKQTGSQHARDFQAAQDLFKIVQTGQLTREQANAVVEAYRAINAKKPLPQNAVRTIKELGGSIPSTNIAKPVAPTAAPTAAKPVAAVGPSVNSTVVHREAPGQKFTVLEKRGNFVLLKDVKGETFQAELSDLTVVQESRIRRIVKEEILKEMKVRINSSLDEETITLDDDEEPVTPRRKSFIPEPKPTKVDPTVFTGTSPTVLKGDEIGVKDIVPKGSTVKNSPIPGKQSGDLNVSGKYSGMTDPFRSRGAQFQTRTQPTTPKKTIKITPKPEPQPIIGKIKNYDPIGNETDDQYAQVPRPFEAQPARDPLADPYASATSPTTPRPRPRPNTASKNDQFDPDDLNNLATMSKIIQKIEN